MTEPAEDQTARQLMAARYGVAPPRNRRILIAVVTVVGAGLLAWLVWAAWVHSTPDVRGELRSYEVVSSHEVTVVIDVTRSEGDAVECTVRAQSEDHSVVGEDQVTIPAGRAGSLQFTATLRTDREATSATVSACH